MFGLWAECAKQDLSWLQNLCLCVTTAERLKHIFVRICCYFLHKIDAAFDKVTESPMTPKFFSKCQCFGIMHSWNVLKNKCMGKKKKKKQLLVHINFISDKYFHMCITHTSLDTLLLDCCPLIYARNCRVIPRFWWFPYNVGG